MVPGSSSLFGLTHITLLHRTQENFIAGLGRLGGQEPGLTVYNPAQSFIIPWLCCKLSHWLLGDSALEGLTKDF